MYMYKIYFYLLALVFVFFPSTASAVTDGDPVEVLIIDGGTNTGGSGYHAPALVPITAMYYSSFSSLLVSFRYDLGTVTVLLENQTTGDSSQTVINALQGPQLVPVFGEAGSYEIKFILSGGHEYIGFFEIE